MPHVEDRHADGKNLNRKRWRVRWIEGTKDRSRSFSRKSDAERFAAQVLIDTERGDFVDPKNGTQVFGPYALEWLERRNPLLARSTAVGYESLLRTVILPEFSNAPIRAIDRQAVERWIAENARRGLSSSRIRQAYGVVAQILDDAVDARLVASNRVRGAHLPPIGTSRDHRYLTHEELRALADATDTSRGLVLLLGYGGLRFGEAAGLRVGDVDPDGTVRISKSLREVNGSQYETTTKTRQSRTVILPRSVVAELDLERRPDEYLFLVKTKPLRYSNFRIRVWLPAIEKTGLAPLRIHELRHTAASLAVQAGANLLVVARMLGHADPSVTAKVYADLFPEDLRAVADRLEIAIEKTAPTEVEAVYPSPHENPQVPHHVNGYLRSRS